VTHRSAEIFNLTPWRTTVHTKRSRILFGYFLPFWARSYTVSTLVSQLSEVEPARRLVLDSARYPSWLGG
jgi:hypothetical protein